MPGPGREPGEPPPLSTGHRRSLEPEALPRRATHGERCRGEAVNRAGHRRSVPGHEAADCVRTQSEIDPKSIRTACGRNPASESGRNPNAIRTGCAGRALGIGSCRGHPSPMGAGGASRFYLGAPGVVGLARREFSAKGVGSRPWPVCRFIVGRHPCRERGGKKLPPQNRQPSRATTTRPTLPRRVPYGHAPARETARTATA